MLIFSRSRRDTKQQVLPLEGRTENILVHFHLLSSKEDVSLAGANCASHYFDAGIGHSGFHTHGDELTPAPTTAQVRMDLEEDFELSWGINGCV